MTCRMTGVFTSGRPAWQSIRASSYEALATPPVPRHAGPATTAASAGAARGRHGPGSQADLRPPGTPARGHRRRAGGGLLQPGRVRRPRVRKGNGRSGMLSDDRECRADLVLVPAGDPVVGVVVTTGEHPSFISAVIEIPGDRGPLRHTTAPARWPLSGWASATRQTSRAPTSTKSCAATASAAPPSATGPSQETIPPRRTARQRHRRLANERPPRSPVPPAYGHAAPGIRPLAWPGRRQEPGR